jgi:hypothetical protein
LYRNTRRRKRRRFLKSALLRSVCKVCNRRLCAFGAVIRLVRVAERSERRGCVGSKRGWKGRSRVRTLCLTCWDRSGRLEGIGGGGRVRRRGAGKASRGRRILMLRLMMCVCDTRGWHRIRRVGRFATSRVMRTVGIIGGSRTRHCTNRRRPGVIRSCGRGCCTRGYR